MIGSGRVKVVQYCPTGPLQKGWAGGIDIHVIQILEGIDRDRFEISAFANYDGWFKEECDRRGFPCGVVERGRRLDPRFLWESAAHLRSHAPDIVHIHGMSLGTFYSYVAARWAEVPHVVLTIHTFTHDDESISAPFAFFREVFDRWVFCGVDLAYTVATVQTGDPMLRGIPWTKLTAVPNYIEVTPPPQPTGREVRAEFGIGDDELILITVSRLTPQKGIRYLLEAAPAVLRARPDVRFLIVGEGPLREELLGLKDELGLGDKVIFAGFRQDVLRLLAGVDLFVLPSLFEGMPAAILESMRAGLATVATDVCGVPELVGDAGILVPAKDPAALAEGIIRTAGDLERMREMGRRARKRIEEHFSLEVALRKVEAVYDRVMAQAHS